MKAPRSRKPITSGNDHGVPRGPERPYEIVAADLRRRIAAGEWQPGEALPTVAALAEHYEVSKATVTRTLRCSRTRDWCGWCRGGDVPRVGIP